MSSVKKNFSKAIGYIKRDIQLVKEEQEEIKEFLSYYTSCSPEQYSKRRERIEHEEHRLLRLKGLEKKLLGELSFYKEYFRYSAAEIDAIPTATEESIRRDAIMMEQERRDCSWTEEDTKRVFRKAGIELG